MLPEWPCVAPPGRGVTANLIARRILLPRVAVQWPDIHRQVCLDERWASRMTGLLERERETLTELLLQLRIAVDRAMKAARRGGLDVTVTQAAAQLATAFGTSWRQGSQPTPEQLDDAVAMLLRRAVPVGRRLSRKEFERYRDLYDELWASDGRANLAAIPYSGLGLGRDRRPPLVVVGSENTFDALERSLYSRFWLAVRDPNVEGDADRIARREVRRACEPLGLCDESARVTLRSLNAGFLFGPDGEEWRAPRHPPERRSWSGDHQPLRASAEAVADPGLPTGEGVNAGIAARAQAMLASFASRTAQGRLLKLAGRMEEACEDAMARAWLDCFRLDRAGRPVTGEQAARIVAHAIYHGIPSGQQVRARRVRCPPTVEPVHLIDEQRLNGQMRRALEWLAADQLRAEALLSGDAIVEALYAKTADVKRMVPLKELVGYAADLVIGAER